MENQHIKDLLTAQVLTLAKQLKDEKKARGTSTTSDCVPEAARLIRQKQAEVLRLLAETA